MKNYLPFSPIKMLCASLLLVGQSVLPNVGGLVFAQAVTSGQDQIVKRYCTTQCDQTFETIGVDRAGNGTAIWTEPGQKFSFEFPGQQIPYRNIVFSRFSASSGQWGPAQKTQIEAGISPMFKFDAQGNAMALWIDVDQIQFQAPSKYSVMASRFSAAQGTWSTPVSLYAQSDRVGIQNFEVAANGNVVVDVSFSNLSFLSNYFYYDSVTSTWNDIGSRNYGLMGIDLSGYVTLAYANLTRNTLEFDTFQGQQFDVATKTWSAPQIISGHNTFDRNVAITKDQYGTATFIYDAATYSSSGQQLTQDLRSARYQTAKGTWMLKTIPRINSNIARNIKLATDRFGNVNAIYNQYVGGYAKTIFSKYSSTTGTWGTPRVLSSGNFITRDADIKADASGNLTAVWSQRTDTGTGSSDGKIFRTTVARYNAATGVWGTPQIVQDANRNSYLPRIDVDGRGQVFLLWNQDSGVVANSAPVKELVSDSIAP